LAKNQNAVTFRGNGIPVNVPDRKRFRHENVILGCNVQHVWMGRGEEGAMGTGKGTTNGGS
jgi:hypothetical protein